MPQFDTFSFFSQTSWVLFLFTMVYLALSCSLSPAVATILKVRKLQSVLISRGVVSFGGGSADGAFQKFFYFFVNAVESSKFSSGFEVARRGVISIES
mmetsp:Transcript_66823/g.111032  ORF Transcript_66823/g.111032 Transcript_66823/m.111032 type:complete len:98 (-) Transcript_66823:106-399(-)